MESVSPQSKNVRILHLATDDKFIDQAYQEFERVAPGANDVFIYGKLPLRYVKLFPALIISRFQVRSASLLKKISEYDFVLIHSLDHGWLPLIQRAPDSVCFVWIGWGFDYYDIVFRSESEGLLPATRDAFAASRKRKSIISWMKDQLRLLVGGNKMAAIEKISYFAPVLSEDYDLVIKRLKKNNIPAYISWNYGNLEDDLIKGFESDVVEGRNILVGNSASPNNNHIDAFEVLKPRRDAEQKIIVPLSYGDHAYGEKVQTAGRACFGESFQPLIDFMPIQEYLNIIRSCGFVVMNHVRQQAVGNVVVMLYLGAKVFLREESPVYRYLKNMGAHVFTVQELAENPSLLKDGLGDAERKINRNLMIEHWSREVADRKTRNLIKCLLDRKVVVDGHT